MKPLIKDFLNVIDSFNLVQFVTDPTHEHGHTLDLVLSCGLQICNLEICESSFSDHMPVLFEISLPYFKPSGPARRCRVFNSSTAAEFSTVFKVWMKLIVCSLPDLILKSYSHCLILPAKVC